MPPSPVRRHRLSGTVSYLAIALLIVFAIAIHDWWLAQRPFVEAELEQLDNVQEKQIETYLAVIDWLTTIATLTLGAVGALLLNEEREDRRVLVGSGIAASASLYFGWSAQQNLLWMLQHRFLNLDHLYVAWPARLQFGCVAIAAMFLFRAVAGRIGGR